MYGAHDAMTPGPVEHRERTWGLETELSSLSTLTRDPQISTPTSLPLPPTSPRHPATAHLPLTPHGGHPGGNWGKGEVHGGHTRVADDIDNPGEHDLVYEEWETESGHRVFLLRTTIALVRGGVPTLEEMREIRPHATATEQRP